MFGNVCELGKHKIVKGTPKSWWSLGLLLTFLLGSVAVVFAEEGGALGATLRTDPYGRVVMDESGRKINYDPFESEGLEASAVEADVAARRAIQERRDSFREPPGRRIQSPVPISPEWTYGIFGSGIGDSGLQATDLNGDGVIELVADGQDSTLSYWYVLQESNGGYEKVWISSPLPAYDSISTLRTIDVDGDGLEEVLIGAENEVQIYDGLDPVLTRTIVTTASEVRALEVADVDADGALELIVVDTSKLFVYDYATGTPEYEVAGLGGYDLAVGNVDADADVEIAIAGTTSGVVVTGGTGIIEWTSPNGFGRLVALGDLDGDGRDEVAGAPSARIEVYDVDLGTLAWSLPPGYGIAALELRDVEADGDLELVYGESQWGELHVHDGATGALEWSQNNPEYGVTNIEVADVDSDGTLELLWAAGSGSSGPDYLYVVDTVTQALEWRNDDIRGPFFGLDHGDVDADATPELLFSSFESESGYGDGLYFVHNAVNKSLEFVSPEPTGIDFSGARRVRQAQADGDAAAEIFFTSSSGYDGKIFRYDGSTHLEELEITIESGLSFASLDLVDVDGDGDLEIVAGTRREHTGASGVYLYVYDAGTGTLEWQSPNLGSGFVDFPLLRIAEVDGDPGLEILVAETSGNLKMFDGSTHTLELDVDLNLTALDTADLDGDGAEEVFIGTGVGALEEIDPANGATVDTIGLFGSSIEGLAVVDLDDDGWADFVFGAADQVRLVDGLSRSLVWSSGHIGVNVGAEDSLLVADIDGDGKREVTVNTGIGVRVYEVGYGLQTPPQVTLTSPVDGGVFTEGDAIALYGAAFDAEEGDLTSSLAWSSDLDGALGTGGTLLVSNFSVGTHLLTASVIDGTGRSDSASVSIEIQSILSVGLAGYWPLDEGASTTAADASGEGYDGTLVGAPLWTTGLLNGGLTLDGVSDAVAFGATPRLDQPTTLTLAAWVRHGTADGFHSILDKRDGGADGYDLYINNTGRSFLRINNNTLIGNTVVADDTWHHVVGVYDGTQMRLYVDGVEDAVATVGASSINTTSPLRLGYHFTSNDFRFDGTLDDVRIYDRALSSGEVDTLFLYQGTPDTRPPVRTGAGPAGSFPAGTTTVELSLDTLEQSTCRFDTAPGVPFGSMATVFGSGDGLHHTYSLAVSDGLAYMAYVRCEDVAGNSNGEDLVISFSVDAPLDLTTGLMGYWPLNDGAGTVATDSSGNGYNGALVDSPVWAAGQFGGGLTLDGVDDGVTTGAAPLLDQPTALTIAAWIRHPASSQFRSIFDKRDGGSDGYDLFLSSTSRLFIRVNGSTLTGATAVDDDAWHHVVGVWDGTSLALYVDGVLDASTSIPATALNTVAAPRLGHHFSDGAFRFAGTLDEVRVYDRALTASEVDGLFQLVP